MALVIKDGKVIEKHLTGNIDEIRKTLEKNKDFDIQKVLQRASKKGT